MTRSRPRAARWETGRREQRKATTRAELLLAGRRLFGTKGLYESRIEDLTRSAGIAKGTLYGYFHDKSELVEAVVQAGFDELGRQVEARAREARTFSSRVRAIIDVHLTFFDENPDLMRIFHQVRGLIKFDGRRHQPLRFILDRHIERLVTTLGGARPSAALDAMRRRELATLLFGGLSGVVSLRTSLAPDPASSRPPAGLARAFASLSRMYARPPRRGRVKPRATLRSRATGPGAR
jgi:AcrR family transcriptional regulator